MGVLTERFGGRRVFTWLLAYTIVPLVLLGFVHDSLGAIIVLGFLLGFAGASFAVGVPFVNRWYPPERQGAALGIYGAGMGGTVLAGLTAPAIADAAGMAAAFFVAAGLVALVLVLWIALARDAPVPARKASMREPIAVLGSGTRAWALVLFYFMAFGGFVAMYLYLPKLLRACMTSRRPTPEHALPDSRCWPSSVVRSAGSSPIASARNASCVCRSPPC